MNETDTISLCLGVLVGMAAWRISGWIAQLVMFVEDHWRRDAA